MNKRLHKGTPNDWPSLALMEFTMALAKAMATNNMKQKDLAEILDVSPPYISSVMSGNENLTVEQMSRLANAVGGSLHLTIAPQGLFIRWVEDTVTEESAGVEVSQPLHVHKVLSIPAQYPMHVPLLQATPRRGVEQPIHGPQADQNVSRPTQPPPPLVSSRNSKPLLARRPISLMDQSERRTQ